MAGIVLLIGLVDALVRLEGAGQYMIVGWENPDWLGAITLEKLNESFEARDRDCSEISDQLQIRALPSSDLGA